MQNATILYLARGKVTAFISNGQNKSGKNVKERVGALISVVRKVKMNGFCGKKMSKSAFF